LGARTAGSTTNEDAFGCHSLMPIPKAKLVNLLGYSWLMGTIFSELPITSLLPNSTWLNNWYYPLVNKHNYGKSAFLMGKSTISMAFFNSYVNVYQRVMG
jgi:hypothetical protein